MRGVVAGVLLAIGLQSAWAHLGAGTLTMTPEAPFKAKATVAIKWTVTVPHSGTDIEYSSNGGKSWTMVRKDYASGANGAQTFNWTVPDSATEAGMIRICQKQGSTGCTNADTVSRPSSAPYTLVSRRFSITAAPVALQQATMQWDGLLRQTGSGVYELNLALAEAGELIVSAFEANGSEAQVLLTRRLNAGSHRLSIESEALRAHPQWVVRARLNGRELDLQF
jgi:hypothetical protein